MTVDWPDQLREQLDWYWPFVRRKLEGLTDDEYLWEPVDGCWSVRPVAGGGVAPDWHDEPAEPPPFTTIAWRLCHIGWAVFGRRASDHFGGGGRTDADVEWPATADAAIAFVDDAYTQWTAGVAALGDEGMAAPCGPTEGDWAEHPMAELVLHINREAFHHAAEVLLLRDLYRGRPLRP
jgi:hypothetical protein